MSSEWQSYQLGDLFELVNGFAFKGGDFKPSGIAVIKIKNVKPNNLLLSDLAFVDSNVADKRPDKELKRGDILITMSGNRMDGSRDTWVGKVAYFDIPGRYMLNQRVGVLRPKKGVDVDRRCCSYFLSSGDFQDFFIAVATSSGGQANLSPSQILGEKINLPPLVEQKQISSLLTALDDRITLLRETNATLEAIAQALFKSWFVDFDPVRAKMEGRAPEGMDEATAALFPDSFEESELGLVPKGWRVGSIYELAKVTYGAPFASKLFKNKPPGKPLVRIRDLKDERPGVFTEEIHPKGYLLQPGDIVVGMDGEFRAYLWGGEEAWLNQRVCVFHPINGASSAFVRLSISPLLAAVEATETATTVIHLGKSDIDRFKIVVPSQKVLDVYAKFSAPLYGRVVINKQKAQTLESLRDTLLPRLISGQLCLPTD